MKTIENEIAEMVAENVRPSIKGYEIKILVRDDAKYPEGRELSFYTKHERKMRSIVEEYIKRGSRVFVTMPGGRTDCFAS